jgi:hypothetical protein
MTQYEHEGQTHPKTATLVLKQSLCLLTIDQIVVDEICADKKTNMLPKKCNKRNMTQTEFEGQTHPNIEY